MKIGILIPCTSKGRDWTTMRDTYFFHLTLKTFIATLSPCHTYIFYIGYDVQDPIFSKTEEHQYLSIFKTFVSFRFIEMKDPPGYLTKMWNHLFRVAYQEGCDYFFQCGDDIFFKTRGWIDDSIQVLQQHDNIGLTGPDNQNGRILTQSFVSRKHMDIFGAYFPETIINWGCDDWYNWVYEGHVYPLKHHVCTNEGGKPRYVINHDETFEDDFKRHLDELREQVRKIAVKDRDKIKKYLNLNDSELS
jgi:hypothetical protein